MATQTAPTLTEIEEARERVAGHARETPVYGSDTLSRRTGRRVWLKAENLQRTGSFKIRGAVNKLTSLDDAERAAGVIAASAGNHGQAVAWAARELGVRATVFMPQDAPMAKVDATRNYGAETVLAGAMFDDALAEAMARAEQTGATFVHAFEDVTVIAGQGTLGLELAEELPEAETFLLPIGGGGLAAGISIALRALRPGVRIVGVQAGKKGHGTIADGIAVKHPGELTMSILEELLDEIVHVDDEEIAEAITLLLERSKLVVEGAGAASVAALLGGKAGGSGGVCALLSGGNIDATLLMSVVRHG
ncbi:MAG TPA: threonine/serine dehydratase, partial [Gaiellaceae bacterium]|nr:threonine/serine dehydratase [Gaiellaceae bacterium]